MSHDSIEEMNREQRLEAFIDSSGALDTESANAVFLTGALVGRLTAYQSFNNVSGTLINQYPVSSVNRRTIQNLTAKALDKHNEYSDVEGYRLYEEYTSRLAESMLVEDPDAWDLTNTEIQWLYALGVSYGRSDSSNKGDNNE